MTVPIAPTPGQIAKLTTTLGTGSADYVFPAINWKLAIDGKVVDVSNFRDGRYKVGTLADAVLSFTTVWDSQDQPTKAAAGNLRTGVQGIAKCYTDATHFFVVPVCLSTIEPHNDGVENVVMTDVTAGLSGQLVYPVDP